MGRLSTLLVAFAALVLAWRVGGGAEPASTPSRLGASAASSGPAAKPGDEYEAAVRLVEIAKDARFELTENATFRAVMREHWRRHGPAFFPVSGAMESFVSTVALRQTPTETQWAMPAGKDETPWAPDARLWNTDEGSFDQRESLVSTAPGAIVFRVNVPQGARLAFAEGTVNATDAATVFVVTVVDAHGAHHEVHRHALQPSAARRWTDASCDLSRFAGQDVELRLAVEAAPATEPAGAKAPATPAPAIALWGNPTILARRTPRAPYNVLWIVVDALRPDVLPSFHDDVEDAAKQAAPLPPLEALLPKIPGLTPAIDELAARGARFTSAYSAGSWTRPGTLAMLAGARSSELGIDATEWTPSPQSIERFYASDPPLLSLALRRHHVTTRAFVNNHFMAGYAPSGIDMGFERVAEHRYRARDTLEITRDAVELITASRDTRFFAFVNYNSPHEPYEPPATHLARVPAAPAGPKDEVARRYMAEAAKDDEAIGVLLRALDDAGLREKTIVILTADHGETMSSAHAGVSGLENMAIRYHHAVSSYEETTRVPIVIVAPGIAKGTRVEARVRTIDIAPTVLDLLGIEPPARMSGRSLLPLARGETEPAERVVVTEGRGSRSIFHERWHLIVREGPARIVTEPGRTRSADFELFDLTEDPGERRDLAAKRPEIVAEMKARLDAALANVAVAGSAPVAGPSGATVRLRFAGGPNPRRVSGTIRSAGGGLKVTPVELGADVLTATHERVDVAFRTSPDVPVGFDLTVTPPSAPVTWELWLDDEPWPEGAVFAGPFGLVAPSLRSGLAGDEARLRAQAGALPAIDPRREVGLFVTRRSAGGAVPIAGR